MRDVLVIGRKDARHLWPQIAAVLVMTVIYGMAAVAQSPERESIAGLMLAAAMWLLVAGLIHEERLVGDRQYWVTRPLAWASVLGAKVLAMAVFIQVPLLLCQMTVLAWNGVAPFGYMGELLWNQFCVWAMWILPVAVTAAVTRNLKQVALAGAAFTGAAVAYYLLAEGAAGFLPGPEQRAHLAAVAVTTLLVMGTLLAYQYARRNAWPARAVLACMGAVGIAGEAPLSHAAFALTARASGVQVTFDGARKPMGKGSRALEAAAGEAAVGLMIPVRVEGVAAGNRLVSERILAAIEGKGGAHWSSGWRPYGGLVEEGGDWASVNVDPRVFDELKSSPVRLRVKMALTELSPAQGTLLVRRKELAGIGRLPFSTTTEVPGAGKCTTALGRVPYQAGRILRLPAEVQCVAPLSDHAYWAGADRNMWNSDAGWPPFSVWTYGRMYTDLSEGDAVRMETRAALGHFEREITIENVALEAYEVACSVRGL